MDMNAKLLQGEFEEGDIIFDCEYCGKSLAIDPRGAGLIITCPDCGNNVQVPDDDDVAVYQLDEDQGVFSKNDIVFDCPSCGKSLAIDERGAGLIIECPECDHKIQIPFKEEDERALEQQLLEEKSELEDEETHDVSADSYTDDSVKALQDRRKYLENLRVTHLEALDAVRKEMATIQGAIGRIAEILSKNT